MATVRSVHLYVETVGPPPPPTVHSTQLYVETVGAQPRIFPGPGQLGCGEWTATITLRGGEHTLIELPWTQISHSRELDAVSDARVTVSADGLRDDRCCDILRSLRAWEHELALYRDGNLVWVGPVLEPLTYTPDSVEIGARDLFTWFERRILPFDRAFTNEDLIIIFVLYAQDALGGDNPGITISSHHTNVFAIRDVKASDHRRAADELRELGRTGLDWTMHLRTLYAGGVEIPLFTQVTLTDETLLEPTLDIRGLDTATETIVVGASGVDPDDPIVGREGGVDPILGLLQTVHTESNIEDQSSADRAARTRLDMLSDPPAYLSGTLAQNLQVGYNDLIAGLRIKVRMDVGCRRIVDTLRLQQLATSVSVGDDGISESVDVTLIPLGTTA